MSQGDGISLAMMINKLQSKEDMEAFRKLPPNQVEQILDDIPDYQKDIIAKVYMTVLLKMNVPMEEASGLVGRVKEKKMAELFGAMEKIDIQKERRKFEKKWRKLEEKQKKIEEEQQRVEEEQWKVEEEQRKVEEEQRKVEEEQRKVEEKQRKIEEEQRKVEEKQRKIEEERQKAEIAIREARRETEEAIREARQEAEDSMIKVFVETLQEMGLAPEAVGNKLLEKYGLAEPEAGVMLQRYWKK